MPSLLLPVRRTWRCQPRDRLATSLLPPQVMATHTDVTLRMLGEHASDEEREAVRLLALAFPSRALPRLHTYTHTYA